MSDSLMIRTEPSVDGTGYVVTVELTDDQVLVLDRETAAAYALGILEVAERADYDAAVLRQMASVAVEVALAHQLVVDLRADRPEIAAPLMKPLVLTPGVNEAGEAFVTAHLDGDPVGQITTHAAQMHALGVMQAVVVADLDAGYLRGLRTTISLPEATARSVVGDLVEHRPDYLDLYDVRTCRACGCTDAQACAGGCAWVAPDLCSECGS